MGKVGIREVAEHAGVAHGTVSHYLNHPERVSPEKAERIQSSIDHLGFVPNSVGRQLRLGESTVLAHIAPDVSNPFFSSIAEGAERRAREKGLSVFVANTHQDRIREDEYLQLFERYRVRGMLVGSYEQIEDRLALLRRRGTPSVLLGQHPISDEQPSVSVDEVMGGRLAGDHLLSLGHRKLAFVGGPLGIRQVAGRLEGVSNAVRESDCQATLEVIGVVDRTITHGRTVGRELLTRPRSTRPDAVFTVNDLLALGILTEFASAGVRVPEDISVIGYDDIDYAASSIVPLSTIRTPHEEFGETAVDVLLDNIDAGDVRQEILPPALVVRASTAGPAHPT